MKTKEPGMHFGPLNEITQATTLAEAQQLVKKAADIEHELQIQVCRINDCAPHGKRSYKQLLSIADCVRALNTHETKIRGYVEHIRESDMSLENFNTTLTVINQQLATISHLLPEQEQAPAPKPIKHSWLVRVWCWWNFRR